jgi:ABC-2 type transport system ATP-binding protein/nitrous oxidase accessory protein
MINVKEISSTLGGRLILDQVTLHVEAGETVALVGANGAGKTTVLRCLLGIVHYTGMIRIQDISLEADPIAAKRRIGYMPQVPAFFEETVKDSLAFVAKLRGVETAEIYPLLERVGLLKDAARAVQVLSTGMRQRLSLAASLIGHPPILILDEPTASVDLKGQAEIIRLLQELQAEGQTILLCSHRAEEVRALVDRIVVMDEGRVVASGAVGEVAPAIWGDERNAQGAFQARRVK